MTVEAVSADSVTCVWFDKNTPRERTFPTPALEDADKLNELLEEIAREREGQIMAELSIVALRNAHRYEAGVLPPGTKGTIVHTYRDGAGYEVEFSEPFHCVVTLAQGDIELA